MGVISLDLQQTDAGGGIEEEIRRLEQAIDAEEDARISGDADVSQAVADEREARQDADTEIWQEINTIEAGSDVVDVVGTYQDLVNYDTSKLHANDLIKVLQDITHGNAITYYRWDGTSYNYVGAEGPYYTTSETDALLNSKQNNILAGNNISIAADGRTISAVDTTYTAGTNISISPQNVISATFASYSAGYGLTLDQNNIFAVDLSLIPIISDIPTKTSDLTNDGSDGTSTYVENDDLTTALAAKQDTIVAGTNIQIAADGKTISATDTTYTHFTGATASADGVQGLVPGPLAGDQDKYLKADGTWGTVNGATITRFYYHNNSLYSDSAYTTPVVYSDVSAAFNNGEVIVYGFGNAGLSELLVVGIDAQVYGVKLVDAYETSDPVFYLMVNSTNPQTPTRWSVWRRTMQQKLTAGTNVTINSMTNTISATDTTYAPFDGATSSVSGTQGLVPAPTSSDEDKYLKGDGTWSTVTSGATMAVLYVDSYFFDSSANTFSIYTDSSKTDAMTGQDFYDTILDGPVVLKYEGNQGDVVLHVVSSSEDNGQFSFTVAGTNLYLDSYNFVDDLTLFDFSAAANSTAFTATSRQVEKDHVVLYINSMSNLTSSAGGNIRTNHALTRTEIMDIVLSNAPQTHIAPNEVWIMETNSTDAIYKVIGGYSQDMSSGFIVSGFGGQTGEELAFYRIYQDNSDPTIFNAVELVPGTTYSDFTGATSSVAGAHGLVPAPAAGDQNKVLMGSGSWTTLPAAKLVEMSYGESSAWAKFIAAYNAGSIVYCRASSNANPATGSQTRKAFMAYVNNATSPTSVEFQYVRSNSSKTDSQQCDQVFVYTLTNASGGTWSVASRDMATKINVDSTLIKTYSSGANASMTLKAKAMTGATGSAAGTAGYVPAPAATDNTKFLRGDGTWATAGGGMHKEGVYLFCGTVNYALYGGNNLMYDGYIGRFYATIGDPMNVQEIPYADVLDMIADPYTDLEIIGFVRNDGASTPLGSMYHQITDDKYSYQYDLDRDYLSVVITGVDVTEAAPTSFREQLTFDYSNFSTDHFAAVVGRKALTPLVIYFANTLPTTSTSTHLPFLSIADVKDGTSIASDFNSEYVSRYMSNYVNVVEGCELEWRVYNTTGDEVAKVYRADVINIGVNAEYYLYDYDDTNSVPEVHRYTTNMQYVYLANTWSPSGGGGAGPKVVTMTTVVNPATASAGTAPNITAIGYNLSTVSGWMSLVDDFNNGAILTFGTGVYSVWSPASMFRITSVVTDTVGGAPVLNFYFDGPGTVKRIQVATTYGQDPVTVTLEA